MLNKNAKRDIERFADLAETLLQKEKIEDKEVGCLDSELNVIVASLNKEQEVKYFKRFD